MTFAGVRVLLLSLIIAGSAFPASITFTRATPGYPSPGMPLVNPESGHLLQWSPGSVGFPQFDPALGELTSVTILLEQAFTTSARIPVQGVGGTYSIDAYSSVEILVPGFGSWPTRFGTGIFRRESIEVLPTDEFAVFPETTLFASRGHTIGIAELLLSDPNVWIGSGGISINVLDGSQGPYGPLYVYPPAGYPPGQFIRIFANGAVAAQVSVTYTYNDVPEPSFAWAIFATVAAGIAVRRRSTRNASQSG
jgi:hypothetical protein